MLHAIFLAFLVLLHSFFKVDKCLNNDVFVLFIVSESVQLLNCDSSELFKVVILQVVFKSVIHLALKHEVRNFISNILKGSSNFSGNLIALLFACLWNFCNHGFFDYLDKSEDAYFLGAESSGLKHVESWVYHVLVVRKTEASDARANSIKEFVHVCERSINTIKPLYHNQEANHSTLSISVKDKINFICLSCQEPVNALHYCWFALDYSVFSKLLDTLFKVFFNLFRS